MCQCSIAANSTFTLVLVIYGLTQAVVAISMKWLQSAGKVTVFRTIHTCLGSLFAMGIAHLLAALLRSKALFMLATVFMSVGTYCVNYISSIMLADLIDYDE